jgi:hypothetical protein
VAPPIGGAGVDVAGCEEIGGDVAWGDKSGGGRAVDLVGGGDAASTVAGGGAGCVGGACDVAGEEEDLPAILLRRARSCSRIAWYSGFFRT